jgi:hypothetical protein
MRSPRDLGIHQSLKYSVAEVVGYIQGKSAIAAAKQFSGRKGTLTESGSRQGDMRCQLWDLKRSRFIVISAIGANGYPGARGGRRVLGICRNFDHGSPSGCSQPSSSPLCRAS